MSNKFKEILFRIKQLRAGGKRGVILHFDGAMFPKNSCFKILEQWRK